MNYLYPLLFVSALVLVIGMAWAWVWWRDRQIAKRARKYAMTDSMDSPQPDYPPEFPDVLKWKIAKEDAEKMK